MSAERRWPDFEWSPEAIEAAVTAVGESVNRPGESVHRATARAVLNAAVKAQPVVALPPCPTCADPFTGGRLRNADDCPACNGSGVERMVPEADLRAWIEEQALFDETGDAFDEGCKQTLDDLSVFLDPLHATMNAAANCQRTD